MSIISRFMSRAHLSVSLLTRAPLVSTRWVATSKEVAYLRKIGQEKNLGERFKKVQEISLLARLLRDTTEPFDKSDGICTKLEETKIKLQKDLHVSVSETLNMGKILLEGGGLNIAASHFDRLIDLTSKFSRCSIFEELKPMLSEAHHWRGIIRLTELGQKENPNQEILRLFRQAVKLNPNNRGAVGELRLCEHPKSFGFELGRSLLKQRYISRHTYSVY